jgi:hypothetical protein
MGMQEHAEHHPVRAEAEQTEAAAQKLRERAQAELVVHLEDLDEEGNGKVWLEFIAEKFTAAGEWVGEKRDVMSGGMSGVLFRMAEKGMLTEKAGLLLIQNRKTEACVEMLRSAWEKKMQEDASETAGV